MIWKYTIFNCYIKPLIPIYLELNDEALSLISRLSLILLPTNNYSIKNRYDSKVWNLRVYISSFYLGQKIKYDNNHLRDNPNTEITNILYKITVTSYLKFHLLCLFISTQYERMEVYRKYIGYAVLRTCLQSSSNRKQQAKSVIQLF